MMETDNFERVTPQMSRFALLTLLLTAPAFPQSDDVLRGRVEVTVSAWHTGISGMLRSGITPVDLRSDLNLAEARTFRGSLV
jgi:hypothetical protein